jgi:hypothetical protein
MAGDSCRAHESRRGVAGDVGEDEREPTPMSDWLANSRGGTRTHDPGMMRGSLTGKRRRAP